MSTKFQTFEAFRYPSYKGYQFGTKLTVKICRHCEGANEARLAAAKSGLAVKEVICEECYHQRMSSPEEQIRRTPVLVQEEDTDGQPEDIEEDNSPRVIGSDNDTVTTPFSSDTRTGAT